MKGGAARGWVEDGACDGALSVRVLRGESPEKPLALRHKEEEQALLQQVRLRLGRGLAGLLLLTSCGPLPVPLLLGGGMQELSEREREAHQAQNAQEKVRGIPMEFFGDQGEEDGDEGEEGPPRHQQGQQQAQPQPAGEAAAPSGTQGSQTGTRQQREEPVRFRATTPPFLLR